MARPKPAGLDLFDELNALAENPTPSEFELAAFRRKVERLKDSDSFHYRVLLGALAAQQGDIEESKRQHELALKQNYSAESLSNYGLSMQQLGFFSKAAELHQKAVALEPEVVDFWKDLIVAKMFSGDFVGAAETLEGVMPKAPDAFRDSDRLVRVVLAAAEIAKERALSPSSLTPIPEMAVECAHRKNHKRLFTEFAVSEDAETRWISLVLGVPSAKSAEVVELNECFTDSLIGSDIPSASMTALVVRFENQNGVHTS